MLVPALLGYIVGAVGIYTLLYKLSPVVAVDREVRNLASNGNGHTEIIELFPRYVSENSDEARKAA